jgi:hypothetical protein
VVNLGSITALPSGKQITPNEKIGFTVVWRHLLQRPEPGSSSPSGFAGEKASVPRYIPFKGNFPQMEIDSSFLLIVKLICACCEKHTDNTEKYEEPKNHSITAARETAVLVAFFHKFLLCTHNILSFSPPAPSLLLLLLIWVSMGGGN